MIFGDFVQINPKVLIKRGQKYPVVMMEDIKPGYRYVSALDEKIYKGGAVFTSRDTLFARITPCLENGKIAQYSGEPAFGSTEFIVFRAKEGVSDPDYVYYLCLTDLIRKPAEKSMKGASGRQRVDVSSIIEIEIPHPDLPTQKKIASILTAYDDLIENNSRRIRILEEMAQMIYREWFVHYRFPGHESVRLVDSGTELGMVPEGWEVKQIGDVIETLGGSTPSTKVPEYWEQDEIIWFTPSDLTSNDSMFITKSSKKISKQGFKNSSTKLFPPYCAMMTSRATIGVVAINTKEACTNQGFITCIPNNRISVYQLYFWILDNKEKIVSLASGATYKEINKSEFRELPIIIAHQEINRLYLDTISPIGNLIKNLINKNKILHQTRDILLPKLISGEFDMSELEIPINLKEGL